MPACDEGAHRSAIVEQFSRQAIPFSQVPGHHDAMDILLGLSGAGPEDTVLDVACGPGLVACAFARVAGHVTGLDITPAMIEQAEARQRAQRLTNMDWRIGEAAPMPFADGTFSVVVTRYSFHHFLEPRDVLREMIRVCRPGGRVVVADVAVAAGDSQAYDAMELIRDPSHTHALTCAEFEGVFAGSGLTHCERAGYEVEIELEAQLAASFPRPGGRRQLREMFTAAVGRQSLGVRVRQDGGTIVYSVPVAVYAGRKPEWGTSA